MADAAHTAHVQRIFGVWLNAAALHGCSFAKWAAQEGRIRYASFFDPLGPEVVSQLVENIQVAAGEGNAALGIFPSVESGRQVRTLIDLLGERTDWTVTRLNAPIGKYAVDVRWTSSGALQSSITGFAPLLSMPVTRRAPYVAMAVWPCGFDNHLRKKPDPFVGIGDMAHDLSEASYRGMRKKTLERMKQTRSVLQDETMFTGMSFCIEQGHGP